MMKPADNRQAGITLLLAIFVMSGLVLIAITVSALAIQSIKNSRAEVFSEPAIGQAQSGAEEGLWGVKRNVSVPTCDPGNSNTGNQSSDTISGTSIYSARTVCQGADKINTDVLANTPYLVYLFDPDDPNGDLNLDGMVDGGYHWIEVSQTSGTRSMNVYLNRIDGTPIGLSPYTINNGDTLHIGPPGSPSSIRLPSTPDPTVPDNRMILKVVYCESSCVTGSDKASVSITSDVGMPTLPTINASGCAQRGAGTSNECTGSEVFNRKINVTVPR